MAEPQYWLPHKELSWVPGVKKKEAGDSVAFQAEGGEVINVSTKDVPNLSLVQPDQLAGIDDVCALGVVHEGALLHTVRVRYMKDLIYTRVARTLIAVNPFSLLPIYSTEMIDTYRVSQDTTELPPHIYAIGQDAMDGLRQHGNQAVLISGESGAGKTESAKLILAFVTDAVRKNVETEAHEEIIEDRVLQTNAVLEAFGNAMTARNNNSSRFGKWLDLRFSNDIELLGCHLTSYLLETTRCIGQANNERSFHIFYQLINAKKDFPDLHLQDPKKYRYLQNGVLKAPGINDATNFAELCDALKVLGFEEDARREIFRIVSGVLNLGNIDFKDTPGCANESCTLKEEESLKKTSELLGLEMEALKKCITERKITIGKDTTVSPLRCDQARAARDSLAKLLYGRLFLWLIGHMNTLFAMQDGDESPGGWHSEMMSNERLLGVLDIAGFESFEKNSLEQLLINLSNEHLHQTFNEFLAAFSSSSKAWDFKKKEAPIDLDASVIGLDVHERKTDQVWWKHLTGFGGAVRHSGDNRTGDGDGDDEVITIDTTRLRSYNTEKLAVVINSFTQQYLTKVKYAYIRVFEGSGRSEKTLAFYALGKGRVPKCIGLFFGAVQEYPGKGWIFRTVNAQANGRTAPESLPAVVEYGKANLGW